MSEIITLNSRYTVFIINEDKSPNPSSYNVLRKKTVICEENILQLNLARRLKNGLICNFKTTNLT